MNGSNKLKNWAQEDSDPETDSYNHAFSGNSTRAMQINKNKIKEVAIIVFAWLFALALVFMVLIKISILFHQR